MRARDSAAVDIARFKEFDGIFDNNGEPLVHSVLKLYLEVTPKAIKKCCDYARQLDLKSLRKEAHSLKSSSANVGAMRLADICRNIEYMEPAASHDRALERAVDELVEEYDRVSVDIATILSQSE